MQNAEVDFRDEDNTCFSSKNPIIKALFFLVVSAPHLDLILRWQLFYSG